MATDNGSRQPGAGKLLPYVAHWLRAAGAGKLLPYVGFEKVCSVAAGLVSAR